MRILNTYYEDVPPENSLTPEEIEQICCERVPVDECSEVGRVSDYNGASQDDIDQDALLEQARADNPGKRILGVRIEDIGRPGKPCGKLRETWQGSLNCCDFVEPMSWDYENSVEVLAPNTNGIIGVNGGAPPYHWSVRGEGFTLDGYNMRDGFSDTPHIRIYAGPFACGTALIEVTDGCSVTKGGVRSTVGKWIEVGIGEVPSSFHLVPGEILYYEQAVNPLVESLRGQYKVRQIFIRGSSSGTYYFSDYPELEGVAPGDCGSATSNMFIARKIITPSFAYCVASELVYVSPGVHCLTSSFVNNGATFYGGTSYARATLEFIKAFKWVC